MFNKLRISTALGCVLALAACNSSPSNMTSSPTSATSTPAPVPTTTTPAQPASTGGGATTVTPPAAQPGSPGPTFLTFADNPASTSAATILTFDTGTNTTGQTSGSYDHANAMLTVATRNVNLTTGGNRYVGIISGSGAGDNRIAALATPVGSMPAGTATYNGTANMEYLDTPSARTFRGTMNASIAANFQTGRVNMDLTTPSGTFGGTPYSGTGRVDVDNLVITNNTYASQANETTSSISGFAGAAGLNSGGQTVTAQGVFAGPAANETGAVLHISDGANGLANITVTGR